MQWQTAMLALEQENMTYKNQTESKGNRYADIFLVLFSSEKLIWHFWEIVLITFSIHFHDKIGKQSL